MDQELTESGEWLSACGTAACIEVNRAGPVVLIRTSRDPANVVAATREEWEAFVAAIHEGRIA